MTATTFKYLKLEEALMRIGDTVLVHDMLYMLHQSIGKDWHDFEDHMASHRYSEAGKILHILKGSIPFFTASETAEALQKMDMLLKNDSPDPLGIGFLPELRTHVAGFMLELDTWIKNDKQA